VPTLGLNAVISVGANALGVRLDPYTAYNFLVEIEGLIVGGFTEVTGLQVEVQVEEYREGGLNEYVHKLPGPTRYPQNLVLRHGLTDIDSLWSWHQDVCQGKVQRKNGSIYLLDRLGLPAMWWDFSDAYPIRWTGPELRAANSAVAVESVELVHRGISKPGLSSALSAVRGAVSVAGQLF
jgi:phage tail-like protein